MGYPEPKPVWIVLNQSESPDFQTMLEALSSHLGPGLVYTGTPFRAKTSAFKVEKGPTYDRRATWQRALSWARYTIGGLSRVLHMRGRPFLLAVTNPPTMPHVAWFLHKVRGIPYALLIWDIYPHLMVSAGFLTQGGWVARVWSRLNRKSFLNARVVITIGDRMAEVLRQELGTDVQRCRIEVIPNWSDTRALRPIPKHENEFAARHGQVDKVTVLYSGNIGQSHDVVSVVEAARILKDDSRIEFMIVGSGLGKKDVEAKIDEFGLKNVRLLPPQPLDVLPLSLATGDIAIVTQAKGTEHLSMPSKTYSMMAVGCSILASTHPESDLATLVNDYDLGAVCPQSNPELIANAIRTLVNDPSRLLACKNRSRTIALERFNFEFVFERFSEVLQKAISHDREGSTEIRDR